MTGKAENRQDGGQKGKGTESIQDAPRPTAQSEGTKIPAEQEIDDSALGHPDGKPFEDGRDGENEVNSSNRQVLEGIDAELKEDREEEHPPDNGKMVLRRQTPQDRGDEIESDNREKEPEMHGPCEEPSSVEGENQPSPVQAVA